MAGAGSLMQDFFAVELQTPTGQDLPFIEYDSQRYFVGEPGQEFVVSVSMINYSQHDYRVGNRRSASSLQRGYCVAEHKQLPR